VIRRGAVSAGALVLALVASACALAWQPDSPLVPLDGGNVPGTAPLFLALLIAAFAAYLAALLLIRRCAPSRRAVVALAAAIQLVPLAAPLLLSTDAWTYWSYGWIGSSGGGNPYADTPQQFPANPALPSMGTDWLDTTSVYGPAFTIASEPLATVSGSSEWVAAWTYKTIAAAAVLAAALLAGRLATRRQAFAVAFVGWNPILAVHLAGGGHNDAWVGALLLAALALAASRRLQGAGALWALAIFVKWVPLLFLALQAVEDRARRRRTGYRGLLAAAGAVALAATLLYGGSWLGAVLPLARNASRETSYAIPHRLEQLGVPQTLALILAALALVAGFAWLARRAGRDRARLGLAACLVLLTTPYLAVWYLAWAVPLAASEEDPVATIGCLALCAYLLPQTIPT
jgi:hypothetical protein